MPNTNPELGGPPLGGAPNPQIGNHGSGNGTDTLGDVTVINTAVGFNPTFASDNLFSGQGSIGLYGRSRGLGTTPTLSAPVPGFTTKNDFSIGVLGQSSKGCGIYGLATDDDPMTFLPGTDTQPSHGIGVVGRSVAGEALEPFSVEQLMGDVPSNVNPAVTFDGAIGVLGHSLNGPGVRGPQRAPAKGHTAGPHPRRTPAGPVSGVAPSRTPGGVFEVPGRRQYVPRQ